MCRVRAQLRNSRSNFHRKTSEAENCGFKLTFICSNFPYLRQTVLPLTATCVKAYVIALHCPWPKGILSSLSAVTQLSAKIRNTRQVAGKMMAVLRLAVTVSKYELNVSEVDYGVHVTRLQIFSLKIRGRKRLCRLSRTFNRVALVQRTGKRFLLVPCICCYENLAVYRS